LNKKKSAVALASTLLLAGMLAACTKNSGNLSSNSSDTNKPATAATGTDAGKTTAGAATSSAATGTDAGKPAGAAGKDATAGGEGFTTVLPPHLSINLNNLPDDMVICQVSGSPIKIADYRRRMKIQQAQMQSQLTQNPGMQASLLQLAKQNKIELTSDEKTKLIAAAKTPYGANFAQYLKQNNATEAQFDKQVEDTGLIYKMANAQMQESLLPQMIKQEIMAKASIDAGRKKQAEAVYDKFKQGPSYKAVQSLTQLPEDSLRIELVKGQLAQMQVDKLGGNVKVTEGEIRNWYNHNKSQLQHNERIRLSSILIVAPAQDVGTLKSVRTQLKAANPKWTDAELDSKSAAFITQAQNQALILLGQAKAPGSNFAKIADEHGNGIKNGGDMGWQEKNQLAPDFVNAVWKLPTNTVLPQVVKTGEGFRIVKVTGREGKGPFSLTDVHDLVAHKLKAAKAEQAVNQWVASQQSNAKIEFSKRFLAASGDKGKTN
jgi:PPIC-type PPIASE domain